jgi:exodeoxyribonuclease VII small subunit
VFRGEKNEQDLDRWMALFSIACVVVAPATIPAYRTPIVTRSRAFYPPAPVLNWQDMSSAPKKSEPQMNFEGAMDRLEEIVEQMESGKMMLEELIVRYEEGMKLVKICQERLASAEQRIEIITRNNSGKPVVKNFVPVVEREAGPRAEEKGANKNDDVSLF